jgi:hypothetical protein
MSRLNLLIALNSYNDPGSTNSASHNGIKWTRSLDALPVMDAGSTTPFALAPGETSTLFSTLRTTDQDTSTQYSLTLGSTNPNTYILTATGGTLPNFRTPRVTGADATTQVTVTVNGPVTTFTAPSVSAVAAFFTGQVAGMTTSVTITATTVGVVGNSVILVGDGISSISTLISVWNTAFPSNTIGLTSGDGTQIPSAFAMITLSGGVNSATAFNLISGGVVVGDFVRVGNLFNVVNQGEWKIISVTATSFSVANIIGVPEGPYVLGVNYASQIQIYSAAGVQVNDTLIISSGFSPVSYGSYLVSGVAANWLQFYTTSTLPQEGPITTEVQIYEYAKRFIYMETNENVTVTINGTQTANIEPWEIGTTTFPGQYMQKATIYSLSVTNTSTNAANLLLCSVE